MKNDNKTLLTVLVILVVAVLGYMVLTTREHRTPGEKVNDAVHELQDRTPAEKIQDKINDGH